METVNNSPGAAGIKLYVSGQLVTLSRPHVFGGRRVGVARRNLLGKTDSRTFWGQKKSPKKVEDIGGAWQGI